MIRRNFKICMCDEDGNILSEKIISDTPWTLNTNIEFKIPKMKVYDEVSEVISNQIKLFITPKIILELMDEIISDDTIEKDDKVINFKDAVEVKSKHQLLDMWIADFTFPGKVSNFIQDVAGHGTGDGEVSWQFCFYTDEHKYSITAIDRKGDEGYLGCTASTRKPRAGEDWTRGNDLPDGPFNKKTWDKIILGILRYEIIKLSAYKRPEGIPEDIA